MRGEPAKPASTSMKYFFTHSTSHHKERDAVVTSPWYHTVTEIPTFLGAVGTKAVLRAVA